MSERPKADTVPQATPEGSSVDIAGPAPRDVPFRALEQVDGCHPLADHGLIGDGRTAGLVARDGSLVWLCVPRFDSPPLLAGLLDPGRGGRLRSRPAVVSEARQYYEPDTPVLVTELRTPDGSVVRCRDALLLSSDADLTKSHASAHGTFCRCVEVVSGRVDLELAIAAAPGVRMRREGEGVLLTSSADGTEARFHCVPNLEGTDGVLPLEAGERVHVHLTWGASQATSDANVGLDATAAVWRRWMEAFHYRGPQEPLVRRSAITLKVLDHVPNGAIVAAPTSSLPEWFGGERNWDYRYTWIRDAAFCVHALRRIGLDQEANDFLHWVLDVTREHGHERPCVAYTVDGHVPPEEREDPDLAGYRGSRPVRWGNDAAGQRQHDVFGEVIDCAFQWSARGGELDASLWKALRPLVDKAASEWVEPDHGIWEVRTPGEVFTYSAAMCQVALDRGARLAEQHGLDGDIGRWRGMSERIVRHLLERAWHPGRRALTATFGGEALDASVLALPLRRVLDARHPRMRATVEAVARDLGAGGGLLYRYLPEEQDDGVGGEEGAFLLCGFWLVDNLVLQGRLEEAMELFEQSCARGGVLGLLPEQVDPTSGAFLGNYPQAFSHVGLVSSGVMLGRSLAARERGEDTESTQTADEAFHTAVHPHPRDDHEG